MSVPGYRTRGLTSQRYIVGLASPSKVTSRLRFVIRAAAGRDKAGRREEGRASERASERERERELYPRCFNRLRDIYYTIHPYTRTHDVHWCNDGGLFSAVTEKKKRQLATAEGEAFLGGTEELPGISNPSRRSFGCATFADRFKPRSRLRRIFSERISSFVDRCELDRRLILERVKFLARVPGRAIGFRRFSFGSSVRRATKHEKCICSRELACWTSAGHHA